MNYDKILLKILIKNNKINFHKTKLIKTKYPNILTYLNNRFNDSKSLNETINRIKYHIEIRPICKVCGKSVKYISKNIFSTYCCVSCSTIANKDKISKTCLERYGVNWSSKSPIIKEKSKQTCLKKYGTEFVLSNKQIKEKSKQTCLERYGVDNVAKSSIIKEKSKQTCLERYGVEFAWQSDIVKANIRKTCLERYGVTNPQCLNKIKEKSKQTCLERYGVEFAWQSDIVKANIRKTCLERYGVDNYTKTNRYKQKSKETCIKKYGVEYPIQSNEIYNKIRNTCLEKYGVCHPSKLDFVKNKVKETCLKHYGVNSYFKSNEYKKFYEINKLTIISKSNNTKRKNHTFNTSKPEEELYLYIRKKFPDVERQYNKDKRYPWCCDFYVPELDLFLELNGTWTHGSHPYTPTSYYDNLILKEWKEKSKEHPFYINAIETWTIRDINKRECAKRNNLNFKEVWSLSEGKAFTDKLYAQFIEEGKKFIDDLSCQPKIKDYNR